jgi:deoxyribose-phosphate aldolase
MKRNEIAAMIDHTVLHAYATDEQIEKLCAEAVEYHFASVCVNPCHVARAAELLKGTGVKVATVVGFPLGANTTETKAFETKDAVTKGADEIDMVLDVGAMKSKRYHDVQNQIHAVVQAAGGKLVKVILETCYLTDEEKVIACKASAEAGADYVKTSTGFGTGGATVKDVALMKKSIPAHMKVKASGGIHNYAEALAMVEAGASRLGASAGVAIVSEAE